MNNESNVVLSLDRVGVSYPSKRKFSREKFRALNNITLKSRHGETLGVIGNNGTGKSTLLKVLAGIIEPDRGKLFRQPDIHISLLALQLGFIQELTGRENAIMSSILLGLSRKEAIKRLEQIFDFAEIKSAIDKPVSTYSAGMRSRLGFGVEMEANLDVLLIDEVLGVGDIHFRKKSSDFLKQRINEGRSVVIVSHDLNTLSHLCDRLTAIEDGSTIMNGNVSEVIEAYRANISSAT